MWHIANKHSYVFNTYCTVVTVQWLTVFNQEHCKLLTLHSLHASVLVPGYCGNYKRLATLTDSDEEHSYLPFAYHLI